MPYFTRTRNRSGEPELDPHTYQALLWLAHGPRTAVEMAALLHVSTQSAGRRLSHLHKLNLAKPTTPATTRKGTRGAAYAITQAATDLLNKGQS